MRFSFLLLQYGSSHLSDCYPENLLVAAVAFWQLKDFQGTDWSKNFIRSTPRQSTASKQINAPIVYVIKFYRILSICASQHRLSAEAIINGRLGLIAMLDRWSIMGLLSLHCDYKNQIKLHPISVYTFPIRCRYFKKRLRKKKKNDNTFHSFEWWLCIRNRWRNISQTFIIRC